MEKIRRTIMTQIYQFLKTLNNLLKITTHHSDQVLEGLTV